MPRFEERELPGRSRTILIVEDNDVGREMLGELLKDEYRIIEAANGREGIDLLEEHCDDISLVLLDIYMPELNGFEFLERRRADSRCADIPVIVTTGSDSLEDEAKCLQLGANDFVRKPYDNEIIRNRIANTIMLRESASIVNQLRWDDTTGLYSREFFYRRTDNLLEAFPDQAYDIVCSDIRGFRMLNERYGHDRCDQLLRDLAEKLSTDIPGIAAGGRIGADTFCFLVEHREDGWDETLLPIVKELTSERLHMRFGVVSCTDRTQTAAQLCDCAADAVDQLRYSAKVGVAYYDNALREQKELENTIVADMATAIEEHQFMVYYQPKHNIATGAIAGAEALARWYHPEIGLIQPTLFVPVLERHGLISQLDRYVCDEACREIARLKELGLPVVPISVNISPLDFDILDLPEQVLELANLHGIDTSLLHLEFTESAYTDDPDTVIRALGRLRSYGFKVELDDFGAGYSSLSLLSMLPVDILKIDGSMIRAAVRSNDFRIVQSAVKMGQLLGLETVIEGVETVEALDRLQSMGCDLVQGFYYSWPLRQNEFEEYLGEWR